MLWPRGQLQNAGEPAQVRLSLGVSLVGLNEGAAAMAITGGCLCGAVRFEIEAEAPLVVRQCWRRGRQYLGAGSGTVNAIFRKDEVSVSGAAPPCTGVFALSAARRSSARRSSVRIRSSCASGRWTIQTSPSPPASFGQSRPPSGPASIRTCRRPRDQRRPPELKIAAAAAKRGTKGDDDAVHGDRAVSRQ